MMLPSTFSDHVTKPLAFIRSSIQGGLPSMERSEKTSNGENQGVRRSCLSYLPNEPWSRIWKHFLLYLIECEIYFPSTEARRLLLRVPLPRSIERDSFERLKIVECASEITRKAGWIVSASLPSLQRGTLNAFRRSQEIGVSWLYRKRKLWNNFQPRSLAQHTAASKKNEKRQQQRQRGSSSFSSKGPPTSEIFK